MFKRRDFVIEVIRAETIRELETLISDCSRCQISALWTKADGKQEVKAYLRTLKLRQVEPQRGLPDLDRHRS